MYFSSPIMLWKMFFFLFGIWTINVPEVILYKWFRHQPIYGFRVQFWGWGVWTRFCVWFKNRSSPGGPPLIRLIESRKMLITPFQNIFVLFHFQSEFNYNVKVDEKHTFEVVFFGFHSIDSCPWNRVNFFILSPVSNVSKQQQSIV